MSARYLCNPEELWAAMNFPVYEALCEDGMEKEKKLAGGKLPCALAEGMDRSWTFTKTTTAQTAGAATNQTATISITGAACSATLRLPMKKKLPRHDDGIHTNLSICPRSATSARNTSAGSRGFRRGIIVFPPRKSSRFHLGYAALSVKSPPVQTGCKIPAG